MRIKITDARQRLAPVNSGRPEYPKIAASNYAPDICRRYVTETTPGYSHRAQTDHSIMGIEQRNTSRKKRRVRVGPQSSESAIKQARKDEVVGGREQKKFASRMFEPSFDRGDDTMVRLIADEADGWMETLQRFDQLDAAVG